MKYSYFNLIDGKIIRWIDTSVMNYILPDASFLHTCTDSEWALDHKLDWMVYNNNIVPYVAPSPTLAKLKSAKIAEIKLITGQEITAGIINNALGSNHTYPTTRDDQTNINGLITESLLPGNGDQYKFWCADSNGEWARRIHTKVQIQTVGHAIADHIKAQQAKYEQTLATIAAATTQVQINTIVW